MVQAKNDISLHSHNGSEKQKLGWEMVREGEQVNTTVFPE